MPNYLYNGVELPALPEWTKAYPYVAIFSTAGGIPQVCQYMVVAQTTPIFYHDYDIEDCTGQGFHFESGHSASTIEFPSKDGFLEKWNAQNISEEVGHWNSLCTWSNHDIINLNNNYVLEEASDPVPVPVTYLYNGTELPPLPEWDMKTFPYALIAVNPEPSGVVPYTRFYASKSPFIWKDYKPYPFAVSSQTDSYVYSLINEGETEWSEVRMVSQNGVSTGITETIIWTNHDILNEDGSAYFASSYPTDAETGEVIHDYEIGGEPEPDEPLYRDNATITLGSGTLYLTEYDGETLPDVETVCVEENRMGYTKGGAALQYTEETTEERDDLGYVTKIVTTKTDVVLKCGLITWNAYTLYKLIDRCTVEIQDGKRVVKIGGKGNENGKKYVVVFHHADPIGGDLWALIVGRNTAGFTITCTNEAGALIEPEFKALPHDTDGTLVRLIEGSRTN